MATEVKVPNLGEDIEKATVVNILVNPGDTVDDEQPVIEVETDKANVEVPAQASGTVREIEVALGDEVKVGDLILLLDGAAENQDRGEPSGKQAKPSPDEGADEKAKEEAPQQAEFGDRSRDETEAGGGRPAAEGDGEPPREETDAPARVPSTGARQARAASTVETKQREDRIIAAPSTRRIAREMGVDLHRVRGTGTGGRILLSDVKKSAASAAEEPELPDFTRFGEVRREPLTTVRRKTAEHMRLCWSTIPHVTLRLDADVTGVERVRGEYRERAERAGGKLTITAVLLKIVAAALKAHPRVNSSLDLDSGDLILKRYYHIGMAVDTDRGLLVPVIRDVDRKSILDLAVEATELAERARAGGLSPDELQGGTFTLTNLGGLGVDSFTPIVNHPETAILGVGRARAEPVFSNGELERRQLLPLALSIDHRALDGADGARFLSWIGQALREPLLVAMES
jgi:pyruvate dehydrogenase E2 component (dihydrolipoamide acetyltransferase)